MAAQGDLIQNRYQIVRLLGRGGFGAVYLAEDLRLGRQVAIKEMAVAQLGGGEQQTAAQLFEHEALTLAKLDHPGLTHVWDYFQQDGQALMVMEYVPGQTLRELVEQAGPLPEQLVRECAVQLCDVLGYLHGRTPPLIFRDLKPANVMLVGHNSLEKGGSLPQPLAFKLIDFGIARVFKPEQTSDTLIIGTPGYAPPEQYGHGQTDERSDIYSLGATLHHMLSGRSPAGVMLPPLADSVPSVSPALARIVARATALDPAARYSNVGMLRRDLLALTVATNSSAPDLLPPTLAAASNGLPATPRIASRPKEAASVLPPRTLLPVPMAKQTPLLLPLIVLGILGVLALGALVARAVLVDPAQDLATIDVQPTELLAPGAPTADSLDEGPAPSPPGAEWLLPGAPGRIAFGRRDGEPAYTALSATLDGGPPQLLSGDSLNTSMALSPDGSRLAVTRLLDGNRTVFIKATDDAPLQPIGPPDIQSRYPSWSPDGQRVALAASSDGQAWRLATVDLASGEINFPGPRGVSATSWSSQGLLAYSGQSGPAQDIFVLQEGSESRNLTDSSGIEEDFPSFSPGGERLAFVASPAGQENLDLRQIFVINSDGSGRTQLTSGPGPHTNPVWSPDGSWIAYLSKAAGGDWQVWAMRADGSEPRQLTFGAEQKFYLAWGL